jgi:autotransporter-associated beta strand protein
MKHPALARRSCASIWAGFLTGMAVSSVQAASDVWSATAAAGAWETGSNWVSGNAPGATSGTASTDVATFKTGSTSLTVLPDAGRNILGITFDTSSAGAYVVGAVGGNALLLSSGGSIQNTAAVNANQTVSAPLVLQGDGGTYAFTANSTASSNTRLLLFNGRIAGAAAASFTNTLTLGGVNTGANALGGGGGVGDGTGGGALALAKSGSGTWVLAGTNTYSGGTTLNSGTLHLNNPFALGTGPLALGGGTLMNSKGSSVTLSNAVAQTWAGDFSFAGKASQTDPKVSWNLNLNTGAVALTSSRTVTVTGNSSANGWSWEGATLTVGGAISDGGNGYSLTKAGSGTLLLSASNTFAGGVTLSAGTLSVGHNNAIGPGPLTINGGTLYHGASRTLTHNNTHVWNGNFTVRYPMSAEMNLGTGSVTLVTNVSLTLGSDSWGTPWTVPGAVGEVGGSRSLTLKAGGSNTGSLNLRGTNTYSGGTIMEGGALRIGSPLALGTGPLTISGGGLSQTTSAPLSGISEQIWSGSFGMSASAGGLNLGTAPVTLTTNVTLTLDNGSAVFGGAISGTNSLTLKGTQWSGTYHLTGTNTFEGGLTLVPGSSTLTVYAYTPRSFGSGTLTLSSGSGGTLALNNGSSALSELQTSRQAWNANFTFAGNNALALTAPSVALGTNVLATISATTLTVNSSIHDGDETVPARSLTKAGLGTLVLGGAGAYRGGTVVTNGTLVVAEGGSLGSGAVRVCTNAVLRLLTSTAVADTATVELASVGAGFGKAYLTNGVTEIVSGVIVGGTLYDAPGTYGSAESGATHVFPNHFSGPGLLRIRSDPGTLLKVE